MNSQRRFNLVIEMLFFSRKNNIKRRSSGETRFNLVIEMLFFSSHVMVDEAQDMDKFQSRNRDAFLFKFEQSEEELAAMGLVSIS